MCLVSLQGLVRKMNIIIVGCGKVGKNLAAQLSKEDNSICVVDTDGNVVHKLADTYDVMGIIGNGASYSFTGSRP